jgi:hypothetical protein
MAILQHSELQAVSLRLLNRLPSSLTTAPRHNVPTLRQLDCPPGDCVAPGTADSRHLQHPFQLLDHDVALHMDLTTSKSSGAQEGSSAKLSQAGMDDSGIDRSGGGCLERVGATQEDEKSQQVDAREELHACEAHTMEACL